MKRLLKSWVFWAFAVPACVLPFLVGLVVEEHYLTCRCGSARLESWSRLGRRQGPSVRISGRSDREGLSELYTDILRDAHAHVWLLQHSVVRPREGRIAITGGPQDFAQICGQSQEFYVWLEAQCASGAISPAAVELEVSKGLIYPHGQFPFGWMPP